MTKNEKIIISLLRRYGSLTKQKIAERGKMGWATAVKMITRLSEQGIIRETGNRDTAVRRGKKAVYYALSRERPLAIGVDVEYSLTRIILTNLQGEIFELREVRTPQQPDSTVMHDFLLEELTSFIDATVTDRSVLAGIGIGIPGLIVPHWIKPDLQDNRQHLTESLGEALGTEVRLEINVRAYAYFLKWAGALVDGRNFLLVSIRTGLGTGIILDNRLYTGYRGIAGELGHFQAVEHGQTCRCGKTGCLETEVNQISLYEKFRAVDGKEARSGDPEELFRGLEELFTAAASGVPAALEIVQNAARQLGKALSYMVMTLYTTNIFIGAHFGPHGDVLVDQTRREMEKDLLPHMSINVRYHPFIHEGFTQGAALLILSDYLDDAE